MKKIINGKKYDTATAKAVGEWDNGYCGSHQYCNETLYLKRTGEYFLYGEGGPASKYCTYYGSMRSAGEDIIPLTESEAREWVEKHLTADNYEEIFGEVEE